MDKVLFTRSLTLVLDAGQTLLENGSEVFRVQQTMEIMARSLDLEDFNVYVLTNGIFPCFLGRDFLTKIEAIFF